MPLSIYTTDDIKHALRSALAICEGTLKAYEGRPAIDRYSEGYERGFKVALMAISLSFGIQPEEESLTPPPTL